MATLIPEQPKDCPRGERMAYEKLGRDLDKDWIILHSLGLHGHETKIWGEADIVVLSTKGIFALEVKGGKVSCNMGVWTFGEPGGLAKLLFSEYLLHFEAVSVLLLAALVGAFVLARREAQA